MAVKGLLEGWFGGRLGVCGPRTPKLPRALRNGDPALLFMPAEAKVFLANRPMDGQIRLTLKTAPLRKAASATMDE